MIQVNIILAPSAREHLKDKTQMFYMALATLVNECVASAWKAGAVSCTGKDLDFSHGEADVQIEITYTKIGEEGPSLDDRARLAQMLDTELNTKKFCHGLTFSLRYKQDRDGTFKLGPKRGASH